MKHGVVAEIGTLDEVAQRTPVAVGLEEHELDMTTIRCDECADERIDDGSTPAHGPRLATLQRRQEIG